MTVAAMKNSEGYGVTGFPQRAGDGLIKASAKFKVPKVPKATPIARVKAPKIARPTKGSSKLF